jgi:hypothetical protein
MAARTGSITVAETEPAELGLADFFSCQTRDMVELTSDAYTLVASNRILPLVVECTNYYVADTNTKLIGFDTKGSFERTVTVEEDSFTRGRTMVSFRRAYSLEGCLFERAYFFSERIAELVQPDLLGLRIGNFMVPFGTTINSFTSVSLDSQKCHCFEQVGTTTTILDRRRIIGNCYF